MREFYVRNYKIITSISFTTTTVAALVSAIYMIYYAATYLILTFALLFSSMATSVQIKAGIQVDPEIFEKISYEVKNSTEAANLLKVVSKSYDVINPDDQIRAFYFHLKNIRESINLFTKDGVFLFILIIIVATFVIRTALTSKPKTFPRPQVPEFDQLAASLSQIGFSGTLGVSAQGTFIDRKGVFISIQASKLLFSGKKKSVLFIIMHEIFHKITHDISVNRLSSYMHRAGAALAALLISIIIAGAIASIKIPGLLAIILTFVTGIFSFAALQLPHRWFRYQVEHLADMYGAIRSKYIFQFQETKKNHTHPSSTERLIYTIKGETHYHAAQQAFMVFLFMSAISVNLFGEWSYVLFKYDIGSTNSALNLIFGLSIVAHGTLSAISFKPSKFGSAILLMTAALPTVTIIADIALLEVTRSYFSAEVDYSAVDKTISGIGLHWICALTIINLINGGRRWIRP